MPPNPSNCHDIPTHKRSCPPSSILSHHSSESTSVFWPCPEQKYYKALISVQVSVGYGYSVAYLPGMHLIELSLGPRFHPFFSSLLLASASIFLFYDPRAHHPLNLAYPTTQDSFGNMSHTNRVRYPNTSFCCFWTLILFRIGVYRSQPNSTTHPSTVSYLAPRATNYLNWATSTALADISVLNLPAYHVVPTRIRIGVIGTALS